MGLKMVHLPVTGPAQTFESPDLDLDDVARRIGADSLDLVNVRPRGISVLVDDLALVRSPRPAINLRATDLTGYPGGIHGDVVVVGLDPDTGETTDTPAWVTDFLAEPDMVDQVHDDALHVILDGMAALTWMIHYGVPPWVDYEGDPRVDPKVTREGYLDLMDQVRRWAEARLSTPKEGG